APELFQGKLTPACDQYSLAVVYAELLTGKVPFDGKNCRQLMLQHSTETPNLEGLPASDLAIIARALAKDPAQRFASCTELINAPLCDAGATGTSSPEGRPSEGSSPDLSLSRTPQVPEEAKTAAPTMPRTRIETRINLPRMPAVAVRPGLARY